MQSISNQSIVQNCSYINGQWLAAENHFEVFNPADGQCITQISDVELSQVISAINAASSALKPWRELGVKERGERLGRWLSLMRENLDDLARLLTLEQGKPLQESKTEILHAANYTEIYSKAAEELFNPETIDGVEGKNAVVVRRPVGVVSAITPWNFPCSMVIRKAAAALAAGCTVVLKPSELTPLSALALAKLSEQADIPKGVFNVVVGSNAQAIGELLSQHPKVAKLSFTGSTKVGKKLLVQCAEGVKRTAMELGGNAPFIVFDDADLDSAIEGAMASKFRNAGQTCVSANRFLIQSGIFEQFKLAMMEQMDGLLVGNGLDISTTLGPVISLSAKTKLEQLQLKAQQQGAQVCYSGDLTTEDGHFYPPTIIQNVSPSMDLFNQEIFGPIVCLTKFETEAQAIALANQTPMGLCGYAYTSNQQRQHTLSEELEFGMLGINHAKLSNPAAPFGGIKQSGMGREGGRYGVEEYLDYYYLCHDNHQLT